jgi:hypothetical protein
MDSMETQNLLHSILQLSNHLIILRKMEGSLQIIQKAKVQQMLITKIIVSCKTPEIYLRKKFKSSPICN